MTAKAAPEPMKATVNREELRRELTFVSSAAKRNAKVPILRNVFIEAGSGKLSVRASDLELWLQSNVAANNIQAGSITAPCKELLQIIRAATGETVTLSVSSNRLTVTSGASQWAIEGNTAEAFPKLEESEYKPLLNIEAAIFAKLIRPTIHAVTEEESRYALNVILLDAEKGKLRAIATDGHRLVISETDNEGAFNCLLPLGLTKKALECKESLSVTLSDKHIRIITGNRLLIGRVRKGDYPDYTKVIPIVFSAAVNINSLSLRSAIGRVALMADRRSRGVTLAFKGDSLTLSASNLLGESSERLTIEGSAKVGFGMNADYIRDALAHMGETCTLNLKSEYDPAMFESNGLKEIIMPLRLQ